MIPAKRYFLYLLIIKSLICLYLIWSQNAKPTSFRLQVSTTRRQSRRGFLFVDNVTECYTTQAFFDDREVKLKLPNIQEYEETFLKRSTGNNIFFHQTDCIHNGVLQLSARQACGVESAARQNPDKEIFLIYVAPVGLLNKTELPFLDAILTYKNVHVANVDMDEYSVGTPTEEWIAEERLYRTKHVKYHVSDYLRMVSLFKYGGTCLDLDVIVRKNLANLGENFAGAAYDTLVYNGILNLTPNGIGRKIAEKCLDGFIRRYQPADFSTMGQVLFTKVLNDVCQTELTAEMTRENCDGFQVYPQSEFYAYDWQDWIAAFQEEDHYYFTKLVKHSSIVHFSHKVSVDGVVKKGVLTGYDDLAQTYCPIVHGVIPSGGSY